jgi:preprotein translocase subunit Sec61beta
MPESIACWNCGQVRAEVEYEVHEVCALCAGLIEKLELLKAWKRSEGTKVRIEPRVAALAGGAAALRVARMLPLVLEPPSVKNKGAGFVAALAADPTAPSVRDCLRRVLGVDQRVGFAHPALIGMAWRRFGPHVPLPRRIGIRIAGGYLDPTIVEHFDREEIEKMQLMPARIVNRTLVAVSPGPWPIDAGMFPPVMVEAVKQELKNRAYQSAIEIREIDGAVFSRALAEAPWGKPMTFPGGSVYPLAWTPNP